MKQEPAITDKNPWAEVYLQSDWTAYLAAIGGATISASAWTVIDGTVTMSDDSIDGAATQAKCSGGADGETAVVENRVTFSDGSKDVFTHTVVVADKAA